MRIGQDLETQATDRMMNTSIVVCQRLGIKDVVSVQTVCEVVLRQICAMSVISTKCLSPYFKRHLPRNDDLIINAIQLHMLQAPALVDTLRDPFLSQPGQIGSMKHANVHSFRSIFRYQRTKQRSARRVGSFAGATQSVCKNRHLEVWVVAQGLRYRLDELVLGLADVKRGKINATFGVPDFVLQSRMSGPSL